MAPNPLASSYTPDFSEADPFTNTDWTTAAPGDVRNALLSRDLEQRASAARVITKGGASPGDYANTGVLGITHLIDGVVDSIKSGVTLPGDVASGEVDPLSPEGIRRALDTAGLMAGGGLAEKGEAGKLGSGAIKRGAKKVTTKFESDPQDLADGLMSRDGLDKLPDNVLLEKAKSEGWSLGSSEVIHVLKITPEIREQVRKGLLLFSSGAPLGAAGGQNLSDDGSGAILRPGAPRSIRLVPVDHDPFARGGR